MMGGRTAWNAERFAEINELCKVASCWLYLKTEAVAVGNQIQISSDIPSYPRRTQNLATPLWKCPKLLNVPLFSDVSFMK
jgi:hypothetical protein